MSIPLCLRSGSVLLRSEANGPALLPTRLLQVVECWLMNLRLRRRLPRTFILLAATVVIHPNFRRSGVPRSRLPCVLLSKNLAAYNSPITLPEILGQLKRCANTAPGPDDITYGMLCHLSRSALSLLLHIFNTIYSQRVFPTIWKEALVLPFL